MTNIYIALFIAVVLLEIAIAINYFTDNHKPLNFLIFTYIGMMSLSLIYHSANNSITILNSLLYIIAVIFLAVTYNTYSDEEDYEWITERLMEV